MSLIGLVGPCASGKSTLAKALRARGYEVHEILQEHSMVPTMWQRVTHPDVLIYLDVSLEEAARRKALAHPLSWWQKEREVRLVHARQNCNLYVDTSQLAPPQILARVLAFLRSTV